MAKVKGGFYVESLWVQIHKKDGTEVPPIIQPAVASHLAEPIGRIIINWGGFEKEIEYLIIKLLKYFSEEKHGWRKFEHKRKDELLSQLWERFADGRDDLITEMKSIRRKSKEIKTFRDRLSHAKIIGRVDSNNNAYIAFQVGKLKPQKTKSYKYDDIHRYAQEIINLTGRLYWLSDSNYKPPFTDDSLELLSNLPAIPRNILEKLGG